jgi:hypothetical protein
MNPRAVVTLLALATLSAGCKPRLDQKKLENEIQSTLAAKKIDVTAVSCPATMLTKDAKFECTATDANGSQAIFDVTVTDPKGTVSWKLRGKFENMQVVGDNLEQGLSKRMGQPVDVTCPSKNVIIQKGVTFECSATAGPKTITYVFTAQSDQGDWDTQLKH